MKMYVAHLLTFLVHCITLVYGSIVRSGGDYNVRCSSVNFSCPLYYFGVRFYSKKWLVKTSDENSRLG